VPQADIVGDLTNAAAHDDPKDRAVSFPLNQNRATLCRQRGPSLLNDMHETEKKTEACFTTDEAGPKVNQLVDIVRAYLRDHPEKEICQPTLSSLLH